MTFRWPKRDAHCQFDDRSTAWNGRPELARTYSYHAQTAEGCGS